MTREHLSSLPASSSAQAQSLFDSALIHTFGFGHVDALSLFERAAQADPECSMCLWGKAYASGPFINKAHSPMLLYASLLSGKGAVDAQVVHAVSAGHGWAIAPQYIEQFRTVLYII